MIEWVFKTMGMVAVVSGIIFVVQIQIRKDLRRRKRHGRRR